jgi:hypothetical protein
MTTQKLVSIFNSLSLRERAGVRAKDQFIYPLTHTLSPTIAGERDSSLSR